MEPLNLPENYKLAVAIVVGMMFGFVLVKSDLASPKAIKEALQLRNGRIIKTVLLWLGLGAVLFFAARVAGLVEVHVRPTYIWGSVFGGIFCGAGLVLCAITPLSALAAVGTGKFYVIWTLAGMLLAYPLVNWVSELLSKTVYLQSMSGSDPMEPTRFFDASNPAAYVAAIMLLLVLLVHFTVGDAEE